MAATRADASAQPLVAPEQVAGLSRNHEPNVEDTSAEMVDAARRDGIANAVAAVYGPDPAQRAMLVAAIRTSSAAARRSFTCDASAGLADVAEFAGAGSQPAVLDRDGVQFRCTQAPSNPRGIHALCTWTTATPPAWASATASSRPLTWPTSSPTPTPSCTADPQPRPWRPAPPAPAQPPWRGRP